MKLLTNPKIETKSRRIPETPPERSLGSISNFSPRQQMLLTIDEKLERAKSVLIGAAGLIGAGMLLGLGLRNVAPMLGWFAAGGLIALFFVWGYKSIRMSYKAKARILEDLNDYL